MKNLFLSLFIAAPFIFASFNASAATITSKSDVKEVKYPGQVHKFENADGTQSVFQEEADGSWVFICRC